MDSLTSEEFAKLLALGQLLFQDLSYAITVLDTVADEADHIRHMQDHKHSFSPQDLQRPHRWDMPALTQYLIAYCWCFNDWAKAQEAQHPLTPGDFLRCYCTYLLGQTIYNGSGHVAIALGCHYWRYRPRQIENLAPTLINEPTRDRNWWAAQLQARFPTVAHDSLRVVTKTEREWVATFLDLIAPASLVHDPPEVALATLFSGMERSQEGLRIHTLLARCCGFAGLLRAYNTALEATWRDIQEDGKKEYRRLRESAPADLYEAAVKELAALLRGLRDAFLPARHRFPDPDDPEVQPHIPVVPGGGDTDVDPNNPPGPWSLPTPPRPTDLARLQKQFAEAQQQRQQRQQQYRAGVLQIRVDGVPIGEFDVQTASPLQFQVPCDACRVQIYGQDAVGPLLLAVFPMAGVAPATRGKTVTLQLTAARQADGTLTEELVELTYLPSQRVAAFALGACGFQQVHRFRSGLARRVIAARQAVESASVRLAWQARQGLFAWWKRFWAGSVPEADPEPEITDAATESPNVSESSMPVMARSEGGMPVKMGRGRAYRGNERLRHRKRRRSHFSPAIRALAAALRPAGSDPAKAWRRYAKIIATYYKKPPVRDYPYAKVKHAIAIRCRVNDLYTADLISTIMTQAQEEVQTLRPKPMIVLGDYGQGKTCFCGALAFQLAAAFRAHPSRGWLPIIVPLRHLSGLDTINESILRVLQESYGSVLSTADLDRARASSRLFALLDGLDEFMARSEEKDVRRVLRRISIAPLFEGNRLLITTRPNIIGENTHVTELAQTYDMLWIEPLTLEEARAYLKRQGLGTLLAQISGLTERVLSDLIRRPLFLEMMRVTRHTLRAVRSFQDLTEADLFDFYIRYWYDRERKAIGSRLGDLTYDEVDRILCSVAHALTHAGTDSISEEALEAHIASQVGSSSRLALNQLLSQGKERLILVPEFGGSERRFTFRHPSLQSYFTARYLSRQLSANPINPIPDPIEAITTARLDDVSLAFFIALAKKDQVVAARLEQWRQQLADTIHSPIDMRVAVLLLWELRSARGLHIECFRTFCERAPEEVRQFVLSNLKGADFSGMDLSGLRLTRANFRGARLVGTILTGANVGGAVFDEAEMQGAQLERVKADLASFTRAHLTGANLHEFTFRGNATGFAATTLTGATMTGAHFIGANFNDAALQSVDLRQAVFEESTFEGAQIVNALADDSEWRSCNVAGAEFFGTNTAHCVFHETDIEKALRDPE